MTEQNITSWIDGYICVQCAELHCWEYRPFCCFCGARQPSEAKSQAIGLAQFGISPVSRRLHEVADINAFFAQHSGKWVAFWKHRCSHSACELRMRYSGEPGNQSNEEPWLNAVIGCGLTSRIQLPELGWQAYLDVQLISGETGNLYRLEDKRANALIECETFSLHIECKPEF